MKYFCYYFFKIFYGAGYDGSVSSSSNLQETGSYLGACSCSSSSMNHFTTCLWSRKVVKNGSKPWNHAFALETRKTPLVPRFKSAQLGPCDIRGMNPVNERCFSLSLFLYKSGFLINFKKLERKQLIQCNCLICYGFVIHYLSSFIQIITIY